MSPHTIGTCRRLASAFALLLLAAGVAAAQKPLSLFGLMFPDRIAGAQRTEPHDFESKTAGLGYSVEYQLKGWKIDVFIYDLRRTDISDDAQSAPVTGQLAQATGDIFNAYKRVQIRLKYAILDDAARVRFLCSSFGYADKQGDRDSYLCVTSAKGKFIKFRLTTNRRAGSSPPPTASCRPGRKFCGPAREWLGGQEVQARRACSNGQSVIIRPGNWPTPSGSTCKSCKAIPATSTPGISLA